MKRILLSILAVTLMLSAPVLAADLVVIETNYGNMTVELNTEKAPISVANFLSYADTLHYNDTIFHRVIKDFMIQGGNFSTEMVPKKTGDKIKNEASNGLLNLRGTIAMARTGEVDSATSQFFINLKDNGFLDQRDTTTRGYGYAVFGKVVKGMDVVDKIGSTPTHTYRRFSDVPVKPVLIRSVTRVTQQ